MAMRLSWELALKPLHLHAPKCISRPRLVPRSNPQKTSSLYPHSVVYTSPTFHPISTHDYPCLFLNTSLSTPQGRVRSPRWSNHSPFRIRRLSRRKTFVASNQPSNYHPSGPGPFPTKFRTSFHHLISHCCHNTRVSPSSASWFLTTDPI